MSEIELVTINYPPVIRTIGTKLWEGALTLFAASMLGLTFGLYIR